MTGCWQVITETTDGHIHVLPDNDAAPHTLDDGCVCGPRLEHQVRGSGGDGWIVVHHSLDGREKHE